jgi:putative spermidine/putrescine transport system substrate-binding protein
MDSLIEAAEAEGALKVIALPRDWCNYGALVDGFQAKYKVKVEELNPDASSNDQILAIQSAKKDPESPMPDVVDVGLSSTPALLEAGLLQPYKVSTWESIPDELKEADGYWVGGYYGVLSFMVNKDVVENTPQDWVDLLNEEYKGQVAFSADPRTSNQGALTVLAASLTNGGSLDNVDPGVEFFAQLNAAGNLTTTIATNAHFASGATPLRITWDYFALRAQDTFTDTAKAMETVIPQSGRLGTLYVQAITADAVHPNAAKLWLEYLYSDEGQLQWMQGHCHAVREPDLRARNVLPAELEARLPDVTGVLFPSINQQNQAKEQVTEQWDEAIGVDITSIE